MFLEIVSTAAAASLAGYAYFQKEGPTTNDSQKIIKIFNNSGWNLKNETIRMHRKTKIENGIEYVIQLPLGFDRMKIESNIHVLEDGLNTRSMALKFDPKELLKIKFDKTIVQQIKRILSEKKITKKEIEIEFDGMLKIKVYNEPLTDDLKWNDSFIKQDGWKIPVGQTRNKFIYHDFKKSPHVIVAGGTGFGKSQFLKMLITSLIMSHPSHVQFSLIDLKGGTAFQRFKDLKQVKHYGKDPKEAKEVLETVQTEMETLLEKIVSNGFEDTTEAGIPNKHFIIIDEAADMAGSTKCMDIVADIARRGRGASYHLIYCTQYPTNETIPSQVRPNIGARICFKLKTNIQSRAVLDEGGAEELPEIPGRGIYQLNKNEVIQAPYMTNKQIAERIEPHIIIKARKDDENGQRGVESTSTKHTYVIE